MALFKDAVAEDVEEEEDSTGVGVEAEVEDDNEEDDDDDDSIGVTLEDCFVEVTRAVNMDAELLGNAFWFLDVFALNSSARF